MQSLSHRYAEKLADLVSVVAPQGLKNQRLRMVNRPLAEQLQLDPELWENASLTTLLTEPDSAWSARAVAQKYGGHQFGHWNPDLGDGRGLLLGECLDKQGNYQDLHLKGAGQTPYSRFADGRAVLRSTLREYIGSEALHALGIPTSRALCLFSSDETVMRERAEPGAMMIRTAPSHIRFGHFEYFFHSGDKDKLEALFNFVLKEYFSECIDQPNPHQALLRAITLRTARMIALWQCHGFVHGVMNTDNMSIHGITFDYGPYAFIDNFHASAVFNHSDPQGRYAFDRQPGIALWNLNMLAYAFTPYCDTKEIRDTLEQFEPVFLAQYQKLMLTRLGLSEGAAQRQLSNDWLSLLSAEQRDYTASFRLLARHQHTRDAGVLRDSFIDRARFDNWWASYCEYRQPRDLLSENPAVIPRTHLLNEAIKQAESDDFSYAEALLDACLSPYDTTWDDHHFASLPATAAPVSLSCSS
ncbi:protein adenylyltransferase SelO [Alteromonas halophila]|uniref:Protein nucleotidyltransferase YdiU n=1 Tax=Alteromonas halophila TaxID=516698 RepID=A0A918JLU1_9ALTE|nr:YdiU family protein [Alteromonas halophila]GGW84349.1 UPF0061 protein YdiU [Alteromonas halophila]